MRRAAGALARRGRHTDAAVLACVICIQVLQREGPDAAGRALQVGRRPWRVIKCSQLPEELRLDVVVVVHGHERLAIHAK